MSSSRPTLGRAELELLQLVAEKQPISVRDAAEQLAASHGYARTTVLTMLERLRKKGYLKRRPMDGVNHYSPRVKAADLLKSLIGDFVEQVLGGSVSPFIAYLNQERRLKPDELDELKRMVADLDRDSRKGEQ